MTTTTRRGRFVRRCVVIAIVVLGASGTGRICLWMPGVIWNLTVPSSEVSLRVIDLYRDRLSGITERVQGNAERSWPGIEDFDTKADTWLAATAAELAGAQREAVRATQGFLAAFLSSELGQRTQAPSLNPDRYLISRDGRPLNQALNTALVGARVALKAGEDYRQGLTRAVRMIERDLMNAARTALNDGMAADERVEGWQRGVAGTCGACGGDIAKEVSVNLPELPLNIHPNCKCVTVPVVGTRKWYWKDRDARFGIQTPKAVETSGIAPGTEAAAAARSYTTSAYRDLNRRLASGEALTAEQQGMLNTLTKAMRDLPDRPTVWRGVKAGPEKLSFESNGEFLGRLWDFAKDAFKPGQTISMRGLQSTSFDINPALDAALGKFTPGIIFEIRAKSGAYLGRVSNFDDEAELLLPHNAKYRVRKVLRDVEFERDDGTTSKRIVVQLIQL